MDYVEVAGKVQKFIEGRFEKDTNRVDEAFAYSMSKPGKMVRPLMLAAVARAYGVKEEEYIPCTAVVEMLNTATLVLDDMPFMDDANLRRGGKPAHEEFGVATASLVIPQTFGAVQKILAETDIDGKRLKKILYELGQTSQELSRGQEIDLHQLKRCVSTYDDILNCYKLKAGSLIACAVSIGGILGKAHDVDIVRLRKFGSYFGQAYQVADELLDYLKPEEVGKSTGKDLEKATITNTFGYERAEMTYRELIELASGKNGMLDRTVKRFPDLEKIVRVARERMEESLFSKKAVGQNGQQVRSS